jgi:hypothetical protein
MNYGTKGHRTDKTYIKAALRFQRMSEDVASGTNDVVSPEKIVEVIIVSLWIVR